MKSIISKKNIIVLVLFIMCLILLVTINKTYTSIGDDMYSEQEILQAQLERGEMQKELGDDSIYPEYYTAQNVGDINDSEIEESILENKALVWYANKINVTVSDVELQTFINKMIEDAKESEEYDDYEKMAEALDTTYEDIVLADSEAYRNLLIKNKLYEQKIIKNQDTPSTNDSIEDTNKKNKQKWNDFVKTIVVEYKNSPEYENLLREFSMCKELSNDDVTSVEEIKSAEKEYDLDD